AAGLDDRRLRAQRREVLNCHRRAPPHIVATCGVHADRRNFNQATQPILKPRPRLPDILIQSGKYTHHITTGDGKTAGGAEPGAPMRPKPPVAIERVTPHGRPDAARGVQPSLRGLDGETPSCAGLCGGRTRSKNNGSPRRWPKKGDGWAFISATTPHSTPSPRTSTHTASC